MKIFRFMCVVVGALLMALAAFSPAAADGIINWGGHGSENLPCDYGGHWVLAPAFNITSATLHVNGEDFVMSQSGEGSWSADSVGPLDANLTASVSYTGDGDDQNHLQLSHCNEGTEPTPTETSVPPTPTETSVPPTPTNTPPGPTPTSTNTPPGPTPTSTVVPPTVTPPNPTATPPEKITAGGSGSPTMNLLYAIAGIILFTIGILFPKAKKFAK